MTYLFLFFYNLSSFLTSILCFCIMSTFYYLPPQNNPETQSDFRYTALVRAIIALHSGQINPCVKPQIHSDFGSFCQTAFLCLHLFTIIYLLPIDVQSHKELQIQRLYPFLIDPTHYMVQGLDAFYY